MNTKKIYYWMAGEDGDDSDPQFFPTGESFLKHLATVDPILCGSREMTEEEFNNLPGEE